MLASLPKQIGAEIDYDAYCRPKRNQVHSRKKWSATAASIEGLRNENNSL